MFNSKRNTSVLKNDEDMVDYLTKIIKEKE
jgi:hypothetical protein